MSNDSNAPAAGNAGVPADPNSRGPSLPDLSDLQAELDKTADEQPEKGSRKPSRESEPEAPESDDAETDDEPDPFDDEDEPEDEGDDDDGESDEGDDEEEGDEKPKPKKSRGARYTAKIKNLEAEVAELRSRTTAAVSDEAIAAEVIKRVGAEPQEKDFPDYLTWEREHTAWLLDKRQETRKVKAEAKQDVEATHRQNVERVGAHKERLEQFSKSGVVKDFDKVMAAAKDARVSPIVEDLILDSEKSGHLTFYFARNPTRLAAINAMSPRDAAREIGRIESRLSLPKPRTETKAPKPKARPGGGASSSSQDQQLESFLNTTYGKGRR
jgi:hypothetical protein